MALAIDDVEILEREGEFEVVARGQTLQVGGIDVLPLPNARVFTGSQDEFPIKRVRAGYSQQLGYQGEVVLGLPWNKTGGALHEWLLGRPASEFRGDWQLGVGWIQERGVPLEGQLKTTAPATSTKACSRASGSTTHGRNIREIRTELRRLADRRDDPHAAAHPEPRAPRPDHQPRPGRLPGSATRRSGRSSTAATTASTEVPETSTYLHHGAGNRC
jgi:hypothetical protein